jgi:beta-N-acetylhexosaminidase
VKPCIIGISGPVLLSEESALLRAEAPAGVILFARNIENPTQLAALMRDLRAALPAEAAFMVDQEGGRVARLKPPHWRAHPTARAIGALHARNAEAGLRVAWLTGALNGLQCHAAGFSVAAAPVLDVAAADGHDVIGDRAFSADPAAVAALGASTARGLFAAGVQPVGKHAPGHGRARADSHLEMPVLADVTPSDLHPFRENAWLPWMMTAHIRYTARDMLNPATQSPAIIAGIIRAAARPGLGFAGVLTTDDLAMGALSGTPGERAARAIAAGCDIALHCSGVLAESADVLSALPEMRASSTARLTAAREMAAGAAQKLDEASLAAERDGLLA